MDTFKPYVPCDRCGIRDELWLCCRCEHGICGECAYSFDPDNDTAICEDCRPPACATPGCNRPIATPTAISGPIPPGAIVTGHCKKHRAVYLDQLRRRDRLAD